MMTSTKSTKRFNFEPATELHETLTVTIELPAERLLHLFKEARKLDAPVEQLAATLLDIGLEKWLETAPTPN